MFIRRDNVNHRVAYTSKVIIITKKSNKIGEKILPCAFFDSKFTPFLKSYTVPDFCFRK